MVQARPKLKVACPLCRQKLDLTDCASFSRVNCPNCQAEVIVPRPFGNLMLEEPLGDPSAVAVYRALDLTLDREVAVKVLEREPESLGEAFLGIARRAAAINHPGVVPIYSCGRQDDKPYLVSQFMSLGNLGHQFEDRPAAEKDIREYMDWSRMVAAGLHAAHDHDEIHGAVTPSAILLDADRNAKVGDFGLLSLVTGDRPDDPVFLQALPFLAPERLRGEEPTIASDVFGLGVVTYRLLTGRLPVTPEATTEKMLSKWQAMQRPPSAKECCDAVPTDISELCASMMAVDAEERPADLASIAQTLASACKTRANTKADTEKRPRAVRIRAPVARRLEQARQDAASAPSSATPKMINGLLIACVIVLLSLAVVIGLKKAGFFDDIGFNSESRSNSGEQVGSGIGSGVTEKSASENQAPDEDAQRRLEAAKLASWAPKRPRPADLDFLRTKDQLKRYLETLPPGLVGNERERIKYVSTTRDYLIRLMRYIPFNNGDPSVILLRGGRRVEGAIPYCNEQEVALRQGAGEPMRKFAWGDLAFEQYVNFIEFYIEQRTEQGVGDDLQPNSNQVREIAEDCLRAAVLCDWYEKPSLCRQFASRAVEHNPAIKSRVARLLPQVAAD